MTELDQLKRALLETRIELYNTQMALLQKMREDAVRELQALDAATVAAADGPVIGSQGSLQAVMGGKA